jgi:tetratricopeptide (TPR) repeat protein
MNEQSSILKKKNQQIFNQLWDEDRWTELREFLIKWLNEEPDNHWILLHIAEANYQEKHFEQALEYAEKAYRFAPRCPLAMWEYAETLDRVGRHEEAAMVYKKIIRKGINRVAYGECGEGIRWARQIINDSHYVLGVIYAGKGEFALAKKYVKKYISNRYCKYESRFYLREAKKDLAQILQSKNPRDY